VDLGYRVIDDYVQRGQRAAERMRHGIDAGDALTDDVQGLGTRMVQYLSDFSAAWLELLERSGVTEARPRHTAAQPSGEASRDAPDEPPAAPSAVPPLHVRVKLDTHRRARLSLDLEAGPSDRRLVAHSLRSTATDSPRIDEVSLEPGSADVVMVCVRIPDGHPPGTYRGTIVDDTTNRPVGTLVVVVDAAE
jgi:hypothetical protein